jgi:flavodoxin I
MDKIGIFFGTDTGTTRLMAKKMAQKLGSEVAAKPLNVNRIDAESVLSYDALIFGTPTYGVDQLPGMDTGIKAGSWHEFLPQLAGQDFSGKRVALYGLGDQDKYSARFADSLIHLYRFFTQRGAEIIGGWSTDGYSFEHSQSVIDGKFVGLVLDQQNQALLTEERLDSWLQQIKPALQEKLSTGATNTEAKIAGC